MSTAVKDAPVQTTAIAAQTARANHVLEPSPRHLYTRATRPARLRGNRWHLYRTTLPTNVLERAVKAILQGVPTNTGTIIADILVSSGTDLQSPWELWILSMVYLEQDW